MGKTIVFWTPHPPFKGLIPPWKINEWIPKMTAQKIEAGGTLFQAICCLTIYLKSHRIHVWQIYLHFGDFYGFHIGKIYQSHGSSGEWYVTKVFPRLKNGRKPPKPVTIPVAAPTKRRNPSELSESRPGRREAKFCGAVPTHHWFTQKERLLIRIRLEECTTCPDLVWEWWGNLVGDERSGRRLDTTIVEPFPGAFTASGPHVSAKHLQLCSVAPGN